MIIKEFPFLALYISNVEKTAEFYKKIGVEIKEHTEDKLVIDLGGHDLHFILETKEPFVEYQYITKNIGRGQGMLIYVQVENIEKHYEMLSNSEIRSVIKPKPNHWGYSEFLVEDPDGYKIVFWGN